MDSSFLLLYLQQHRHTLLNGLSATFYSSNIRFSWHPFKLYLFPSKKCFLLTTLAHLFMHNFLSSMNKICFGSFLSYPSFLPCLLGPQNLVRWCTIWWAGRWGCRWRCRGTIIARWWWRNAVRVWTGLFFLCLVANEVNFGFAGLCWCWCGNDDVGLFFGFLDQHIDQCLLFVLWYNWNHWCGWCWWWWRLNENDFVVLLWWWEDNGFSVKKMKKEREECKINKSI